MLTGLSGLSGLSGVAGGRAFAPSSLPSLVVAPIFAASLAAGKLFQDTGETTPADALTNPIRRLVTPPYGLALDWDAPSDAARPVLDGSGSKYWTNFDGVNDYLAASDAGFPSGSSSRTFGIVFKTSNAAATQALFSYGTAGAGQGFYLFLFGAKQLVSQFGGSIGGATATFSDNTWYTVIVTVADAGGGNANWSAYIDGVQDGTTTLLATNTTSGAFGATIAADSSGGSIGNFAPISFAGATMNGTALNAAGIAQLHAYLRSLAP